MWGLILVGILTAMIIASVVVLLGVRGHLMYIGGLRGSNWKIDRQNREDATTKKEKI